MRHPAGAAPTSEEVVLSPEWLTEALQYRQPGVVVTGVEVQERIRTVATKVRFTVTYEEQPADLPDALCVKGVFPDDGAPLRAAVPTESVFYRDIGPTIGVRIPPCVFSGIDASTGNGVVIMHDLVAEGAHFGDPRDTLSVERSAAVLDELARLHAQTWGRSAGSLPSELEPRLGMLAELVAPDLLDELYADGRAEGIPGDVADGHRVHAAMHAMAALDTGPCCLVHGDLHTGNMYVHADGGPGLIDWQVVQLGAWAIDVAYHLATALDPAERVATERDLLRHYLDRLASHGAPAPGDEEAWLAYRSHLPYGFFMWGITRFTPRPWVEHFVHRLGVAVTEHDSLGLLGV